MFAISIILFIFVCIAFCYLFYKLLEIEKDVEILYDNYSKEIEKITKANLKMRGSVLR